MKRDKIVASFVSSGPSMWDFAATSRQVRCFLPQEVLEPAVGREGGSTSLRAILLERIQLTPKLACMATLLPPSKKLRNYSSIEEGVGDAGDPAWLSFLPSSSILAASSIIVLLLEVWTHFLWVLDNFPNCRCGFGVFSALSSGSLFGLATDTHHQGRGWRSTI